MKPPTILAIAVTALCGVAALRAHAHLSGKPAIIPPAHLIGNAPPVMLWAWEEPGLP
jgi:hypothetical protein